MRATCIFDHGRYVRRSCWVRYVALIKCDVQLNVQLLSPFEYSLICVAQAVDYAAIKCACPPAVKAAPVFRDSGGVCMNIAWRDRSGKYY